MYGAQCFCVSSFPFTLTTRAPSISYRSRLRRSCFHIAANSQPRATAESAQITSSPQPPSTLVGKVIRKSAHHLATLWQFSRPHTVIGTLVAVVSLHAVAWNFTFFAPHVALLRLIVALVPALALNLFITGLNQLYDIDIDAVNKPYLPLPSGRLSKLHAKQILFISLALGLGFCFLPHTNNALRLVLIASTVLGAMYSSPPFRLKRWPVIASACILAVRGFLVNICFYLHASQGYFLPPLMCFAVAFFVVYGIFIALMKDVPDIQGDRIYGIRTFSVRVGPHVVFYTCVGVLTASFVVASACYWVLGSSTLLSRAAAILHLPIAVVLLSTARSVDVSDKREAYDYYMLSWKAFYVEYLLLVLAF